MSTRQRVTSYWVVTIALCLLYVSVQDSDWRSDAYLHTLMEVVSTLLAIIVGLVALVRYYSCPDNHFLFLGVAFLGTAFLDGYHAIVTSTWLKDQAISLPASLIPWSWAASRFFLAVMLWIGLRMVRRERCLGEAGRINPQPVYLATLAFTLIYFLFFALIPLPVAYFEGYYFLHRPQEWIPALFFGLVLRGYLHEGLWRNQELEYWLVLSLVVNFVSQAVFISDSHELFDPQFDLAHFLKNLAYLCVLTGLLINMLFLYRRADLALRLEQEVEERRKAQDYVRQLNVELEQRVIERTAELTQRTKALEAAVHDLSYFSYSVSHDLRSPLRAIDGYIAILRKEHTDQLDSEGERLFQVVQRNARKMGCLIDDILAYSSAGIRKLNPSSVDMNDLIDRVWQELNAARDDRLSVEFYRDNLPSCWGDADILREVCRHLLDNAIKFSQDRKPSRVAVSFELSNNLVWYIIRDNGVGFNQDYVDKLFIMFQRLHGMEEFGGTGVGLAIVKRYIEKHGGQVAAEGISNGGATFRFGLPIQSTEAVHTKTQTTKRKAI